jgi:hypothetical protein
VGCVLVRGGLGLQVNAWGTTGGRTRRLPWVLRPLGLVGWGCGTHPLVVRAHSLSARLPPWQSWLALALARHAQTSQALTVISTSKRQRASPPLSLPCTRVNARTHPQEPQALTVFTAMPSCSVHARQRTLLPAGQTRASALVESFAQSVPCIFAADQPRVTPALRARACSVLHAASCAVSSTHRQDSHLNPSLGSQMVECWRVVNCDEYPLLSS